MAKYDEYLRQYSAELRAARQYEDIVREIQDERQQVQALQQLIQSERNTLAQLEAGFEAQKTEQGYASEILRATLSSEQMAAQLAAGTRAAQGAAMRVPKSVVDIVNQDKKTSREGELTKAGANKAAMTAMKLLGQLRRGYRTARHADQARHRSHPNRPRRKPAANGRSRRCSILRHRDSPAASTGKPSPDVVAARSHRPTRLSQLPKMRSTTISPCLTTGSPTRQSLRP